MGGQLLSCPFLYSESFTPLGLLRMVVILVCCQSVIPSMSYLNVDFGGTRRNQAACAVALENLQRAKVLIRDSRLPILYVRLVRWPGTGKIWLLGKRTAQQKKGFEFKKS
jgi:hypothetical protein